MQTCVRPFGQGVAQPSLWPFDHLKQMGWPSRVVMNMPLSFFRGCCSGGFCCWLPRFRYLCFFLRFEDDSSPAPPSVSANVFGAREDAEGVNSTARDRTPRARKPTAG